MTYTDAALLGGAGALLIDLVVLQTMLVRRKAFWTAYAIVLGFQLIVNGLLTGLRIVRYDPAAVVDVRVVWAPPEDLLFGFALVLCTLSGWVRAGRSAAPTARRAGRRARPPRGGPAPPARGR